MEMGFKHQPIRSIGFLFSLLSRMYPTTSELNGSSGGIRIHTLRILNPLPLPIGVLSHIQSQADFLPHSYF